MTIVALGNGPADVQFIKARFYTLGRIDSAKFSSLINQYSMGKFKIPVWLQSPAPNTTTGLEEQRKKQNRRSLSAVISSNSKQGRTPVPSDSQNGQETSSQASQGTVSEQPSRMAALAATIQAETAKLDEYMRANSIESPDFSSNSAADFPKLPDEMHTSRMNIIFATKELSALAHGPRESLRWGAWRVRYPTKAFCMY